MLIFDKKSFTYFLICKGAESESESESRVARSRGKEPGVGVRVDQSTLTQTTDNLLQFDPVREV